MSNKLPTQSGMYSLNKTEAGMFILAKVFIKPSDPETLWVLFADENDKYPRRLMDFPDDLKWSKITKPYWRIEQILIHVAYCPECGKKLQETTDPDTCTMATWKCSCGYLN